MAAVIAARLSKSLDTELQLTNTQHFYWTDSQIVLGYLRNEAKRFKTFVANRVQEIQDISRSFTMEVYRRVRESCRSGQSWDGGQKSSLQ